MWFLNKQCKFSPLLDDQNLNLFSVVNNVLMNVSFLEKKKNHKSTLFFPPHHVNVDLFIANSQIKIWKLSGGLQIPIHAKRAPSLMRSDGDLIQHSCHFRMGALKAPPPNLSTQVGLHVQQIWALWALQSGDVPSSNRTTPYQLIQCTLFFINQNKNHPLLPTYMQIICSEWWYHTSRQHICCGIKEWKNAPQICHFKLNAQPFPHYLPFDRLINLLQL